jgi:hypothetical protein
VPHGYDVNKVFAPHLEAIAARREELEKTIQESLTRRLEAKESRKEGQRQGRQKSTPTAKGKTELEKGWEKQIEGLDRQRVFLEEQREVLRERLGHTIGWVAFFHTDQHHRVKSIRFRKFEGKHFQSYNPFKQGATGLFGHSLFAPFSEAHKNRNRLVVVEGEFNLLQIHSLAVRTARSDDDPSGRHYANWLASVGSANALDLRTIAALLQTPGCVKPLVVCQDHDDDADAMVAELSRSFALEVVKPPQHGQDVDDFIRSFGGQHLQALATLEELIRGRIRLCRPWEAVAAEISPPARSRGRGTSAASSKSTPRCGRLPGTTSRNAGSSTTSSRTATSSSKRRNG